MYFVEYKILKVVFIIYDNASERPHKNKLSNLPFVLYTIRLFVFDLGYVKFKIELNHKQNIKIQIFYILLCILLKLYFKC